MTTSRPDALQAETRSSARSSRIVTARWTGVFYLVLAIAGLVGYLFVRNELFAVDDPAATLANLTERSSLARFGIAADLTVVVAQALAAVWFFNLFRREHNFAAGSIAGFGLVNATAILVATAFSSAALIVAGNAALAPSGGQAATVQLLYQVNGTLWDIGGLFFGLWLFPMGYVVVKSRLMPALLGWILMVGAVTYVINTYLTQLVPDAPAAIETLLTGVATVGEFWMIGYLLFFGVRGPEKTGGTSPPSTGLEDAT